MFTTPIYKTPKKVKRVQTAFEAFVPIDETAAMNMQFNLLGSNSVDIGGKRIELRPAPSTVEETRVVLFAKADRAALRPDKRTDLFQKIANGIFTKADKLAVVSLSDLSLIHI